MQSVEQNREKTGKWQSPFKNTVSIIFPQDLKNWKNEKKKRSWENISDSITLSNNTEKDQTLNSFDYTFRLLTLAFLWHAADIYVVGFETSAQWNVWCKH